MKDFFTNSLIVIEINFIINIRNVKWKKKKKKKKKKFKLPSVCATNRGLIKIENSFPRIGVIVHSLIYTHTNTHTKVNASQIILTWGSKVLILVNMHIISYLSSWAGQICRCWFWDSCMSGRLFRSC